jgi:hypothetical protein
MTTLSNDRPAPGDLAGWSKLPVERWAELPIERWADLPLEVLQLAEQRIYGVVLSIRRAQRDVPSKGGQRAKRPLRPSPSQKAE